jgi:hypothetical protein
MLDYRLEDMIRTQLMVSIQSMSRLNGTVGIVSTMFLFMICANYKTISVYFVDKLLPIIDHFQSLFKHSTNMIELRGTLLDDIYGSKRHYSKRFVSVLHHIHSTRINSIHIQQQKYCNVHQLLEICVTDLDDVLNQKEDELLISQTEPALVAPDIYCKFSIVNDDSRTEKTKIKSTNITMKVYSYTRSSKELEHFIDKCQENYDEYLAQKLNQNMYYFVYDKVYDDEGTRYGFKKIKFESCKTFDNVFFGEKEVLKQRLEFFEKNKSTYDKLGIPHTFGILMHGDPGTGKTSTIKAIANYTKRHIIAVPLYKIKDISVLMKLFLNVDIDGVNVPFNKRIYVFEEIDCNGLKDIVQQRNNTTNSENSTKNKSQNSKHLKQIASMQENGFEDLSTEQITTLLAVATTASKSETTNKSLTLGGILELLDGLVETPGRILIITTNHPDELDQALTRPGRIDMNIHFNKASKDDIASMYEMWFNNVLSPFELESIDEYKFTHAELCQVFFNHRTNPQNALNILTSPQNV